MQEFYDFLSFKIFISLDVLIVFYYLGALGVPIAGWSLARWLKNKFCTPEDEALSKGKYQTWFVFIFIMMFIFMEIVWRVMFEFLVAYFQMHAVIVS